MYLIRVQHINPCPPSWLGAGDRAALMGDSIEGTAYNQRWLLTTLMNMLRVT